MRNFSSAIASVAACAAFAIVLGTTAGCRDAQIGERALLATAGVPAPSFVYPVDGQVDVPRGTRIYIAFSTPVDPASVPPGFSLTDLDDPAASLDGSDGIFTFANDDAVLNFSPDAPLAAGHTYEIVLQGAATPGGTPLAVPAAGVLATFTARSLRTRNDGQFEIVEVSPEIGALFDFSVFRVVFNEPVDPESVQVGTSFTFERTDTGEPIPGRLLVRGAVLVFDPLSDLEPGVEYEVALTSGITDLAGDALAGSSYTYTALPTEPRSNVVNEMHPSYADGVPPEELPISKVAALPVNSQYFGSILIGDQVVGTSGGLGVDMGDPVTYPDGTPLRIAAGQVILSSPLEVQFGGQIPAGMNTGVVSLQFISDVTGDIRHNPFRDLNPQNPPVTELTFDAVVVAEDGRVNAVLNQEQLNVRTAGIVEAEGDQLIINLVGSATLDVLGAETVPVRLVYRFESPVSPVVLPPDEIAPAVSAVYPQPDEENVPVNASVAVTFNEAVDPASLAGNVGLTDTDLASAVSGTLVVDGTTALFRPSEFLNWGTNYEISVATGVTDLAGNALGVGVTQAFTTRPFSTESASAIRAVAVSPGVPCPLINAGSGNVGECVDADPDGYEFARFTVDPEQPLEVFFSKPVDEASVDLGSSVRVETDPAGAPVPGTLRVGFDKIVFVPNETWEEGQDYRLVLVGGGDDACDGGEICADPVYGGEPLDTDIVQNEAAGGPDIVVPFVGGPPVSEIRYGAITYPITDTNASGARDGDETAYPENSSTMTCTSGALCVGTTISDSIYTQGSLLTVIGPYDELAGVVLIDLPPGSWFLGTNAMILVAGVIPLNPGITVIRPVATAAGAIRPPGMGEGSLPVLDAELPVRLDVTDDGAGALLPTDVHMLHLVGPVDFLPDGRLVATVTNVNQIDLNVLDGALVLSIQPGDAQIRAVAPPIKQ